MSFQHNANFFFLPFCPSQVYFKRLAACGFTHIKKKKTLSNENCHTSSFSLSFVFFRPNLQAPRLTISPSSEPDLTRMQTRRLCVCISIILTQLGQGH